MSSGPVPASPHRRIIARATACLLGLALLAGCVEPSAPADYAAIQSAKRVGAWQVAADGVVQRMQLQGFLPSPKPTAGPARAPLPGPFYVHVMVPGSTFLEEMRLALQRDLMGAGQIVANDPYGATVVNLDVDVVHWDGGRTEAMWHARVKTEDWVVLDFPGDLSIRDADIALYRGTMSLAALNSPGTAPLGSPRPLTYGK